MRTITTTTTVAGFRFRATFDGTTIVPANAMTPPTPKVRVEVLHVGSNGGLVRIPRKTPQTVTRKRGAAPLPPRPDDASLAAVLAMPEFAGVPDLLARMAAAYEALEFPVSPPTK